jgi:hypothetical protein
MAATAKLTGLLNDDGAERRRGDTDAVAKQLGNVSSTLLHTRCITLIMHIMSTKRSEALPAFTLVRLQGRSLRPQHGALAPVAGEFRRGDQL